MTIIAKFREHCLEGPIVCRAVVGFACARGFQFLASRIYNEGHEFLEYLKLAAHLLWSARNHPAESLLSGLEVASGKHRYRIRYRIFGLFGPHMIFPCDEGLATYVTQSKKFKRMNPLTDKDFPVAPKLVKLLPIGKYIKENLAASVWCHVDGDIHHRTKDVYTGYAQARINQGTYDLMHKTASGFVENLIQTGRSEFMLFEMLQEMLAVVQLKSMLKYELTTCSLQRYVELANLCFQAVYTLKMPPEDVLRDFQALRTDIISNGGDDGIVGFFRQALKDGRLNSVDEFEHNVVVALLLGQQTLPHASFWALLRLATDPEVFRAVRSDPSTMTSLMAEENRVHGPSSPILMPYVAQEDTTYGPLEIPKGTIIVMLTSLLHTNKRLWTRASQFDITRFDSAISKKKESIRAKQKRNSMDSTDSESTRESSKMSSRGPASIDTAYALQIGRTDRSDSKDRPSKNRPSDSKMKRQDSCLDLAPNSQAKTRYIPFGIGRGACPGQMLGTGLVLNCVKAILDIGRLEIVEDHGLLSRPLHEHILVDTISRPRNDVRVRLVLDEVQERRDENGTDLRDLHSDSLDMGNEDRKQKVLE